MVVNKHGSFYLRSGWGTKIIQAVNADDMIFTPANEMQAVDNIGLGRVMIKALRYWADATGLTSEQKVQGGIREEKTDIYMLIDAKDRYFQKPGSLLLLHRNLARNDENATAWYWAFNEFEKQTFTKEEFVDGLHSYLAVNGMAIKKAAVDKEFNCFKNTYLGEKKFDIKTVADEDTYPMLAPLHMLRINDEKKYEKCSLSKTNIPLLILVYAIAMDNLEESSSCGQISIDKLLEDKKQVGKYFGIRYSKLIEMLMEAENKQLLTLNNNFGNRHIEFALPSTTLNPGYSVPDKACCKAYSLMSAAQAVRSSIFGRIAAISVSLKEAGISKSYLASSRLYSARLRQVALALQKVQWSPALNSPSPLKASSAVGFKKSSAHFRRSSFLIVKVLTFSRRGWKMVIFTEVMS